MDADVEEQLCSALRKTEFSFQVDESTVRDNEAMLLTYVRFRKDDQFVEEMLFARLLETDTKGESIFNCVRGYFEEHDIPMKNMIQLATDGASAMVGRHRGFVAFMKKEIPGLVAIHCVIHRQNLAGKKHKTVLARVLSIVIKSNPNKQNKSPCA